MWAQKSDRRLRSELLSRDSAWGQPPDQPSAQPPDQLLDQPSAFQLLLSPVQLLFQNESQEPHEDRRSELLPLRNEFTLRLRDAPLLLQARADATGKDSHWDPRSNPVLKPNLYADFCPSDVM